MNNVEQSQGIHKKKIRRIIKKENENFENLFRKFDSHWDIETLKHKHNARFMAKLNSKKYFLLFAIAASTLRLFALHLFYNKNNKSHEFQFALKEAK